MSNTTDSQLSPDAQSALSVCQRLLSSLIIGGDEGRKQFESTLHPAGHMANARYYRGTMLITAGILFHKLIPELVDYLSKVWAEPGRHNEEINGEATVLVDTDIAMVWTPYWFRVDGEISHVGTNCFNLAKVYEGGKNEGEWEWKVVMACDTARMPTDEERRRLDEEYARR